MDPQTPLWMQIAVGALFVLAQIALMTVIAWRLYHQELPQYCEACGCHHLGAPCEMSMGQEVASR